ncbi:toxin co-regulated pilus biosynthesis Q family protein [Paraburkholderia hospita]|uniref:toxin co-regulated pilus biosynthesis Q family protein n=1 Tax=Paraburkholderia hospita TaxID=169430 RepID=UPI003ECECB3A
MNLTIQHNTCIRLVARLLPALILAGASGWSHAAVEPDQSRVPPPAGDGWQILAAVPGGKAAPAAPVATTPVASLPAAGPASTATTPTAVVPVVLPGNPTTPAVLSFSVSPQDVNLRNALDRWLQTQGWQLAWKVDDDLPPEFNATFSGDFTSVLVQVMKATNHMRVPTRVCRHTNNVIRVVARAANCQE